MMGKKQLIILLVFTVAIVLLDQTHFFSLLKPKHIEIIFSPEQIIQAQQMRIYGKSKKFTFDGFIVVDGYSRAAEISAMGSWDNYLKGTGWFLFVKPKAKPEDHLPKYFFVSPDEKFDTTSIKKSWVIPDSNNAEANKEWAFAESGKIEVNKSYTARIFSKKTETARWYLKNTLPVIDESALQQEGVDIVNLSIPKQKLQQIIEARNTVIKDYGVIDEVGDLKFPAELKINNQDFGMTDLGFKGDWSGHLNGTKWSMKIKINGKKKYHGMDYFTLQDDGARNGSNEVLFMDTLRRSGIVTPRYFYAYLKINGNPIGLMQVEERWSSILPNSHRRNGVMLGIDDSEMFLQWQQNFKLGFSPVKDAALLFDTQYNPSWFESFKLVPSIGRKAAENSIQFKRGLGLLRGLMDRKLGPEEVFDLKTMAKYSAAVVWWGGTHALIPHNQHFYYNPILDLLEPIGYDANIRDEVWKKNIFYSYYWKFLRDTAECPTTVEVCVLVQSYTRVGESPLFWKYYKEALETYRKLYFEQGLEAELEKHHAQIKKIKALAHEDENANPDFQALGKRLIHFADSKIYEPHVSEWREPKPREIQYWWALKTPAQAFLIQNDLTGAQKNDSPLTLEIRNLTSDKLTIREIKLINPDESIPLPNDKEIELPALPLQSGKVTVALPSKVVGNESRIRILIAKDAFTWTVKTKPYANMIAKNEYASRSVADIKKVFPNAVLDLKNQVIQLPSGSQKIESSITFPSDWKVVIRSGSRLQFCRTCGFYIRGSFQVNRTKEHPVSFEPTDEFWSGVTVDNRDQESSIQNLNVKGLRRPKVARPGDHSGIVVYGGKIHIESLKILDSSVEDALNLVSTTGSLENVEIKNTTSDCIDAEFSELEMDQVSVTNCGDDGLDLGTSKVKLANVKIDGTQDKGISVGQGSQVTATNIEIKHSPTGVAVKGASSFDQKNVKIEDSQEPIHVDSSSEVKGN